MLSDGVVRVLHGSAPHIGDHCCPGGCFSKTVAVSLRSLPTRSRPCICLIVGISGCRVLRVIVLPVVCSLSVSCACSSAVRTCSAAEPLLCDSGPARSAADGVAAAAFLPLPVAA